MEHRENFAFFRHKTLFYLLESLAREGDLSTQRDQLCQAGELPIKHVNQTCRCTHIHNFYSLLFGGCRKFLIYFSKSNQTWHGLHLSTHTPRELHQSPVRLLVSQREVPQVGISRVTSWPVLRAQSRVRSPSDRASTFQADGSHNRGVWHQPPGMCHLRDPAQDRPTGPAAHFLTELSAPSVQRNNCKLTWAEETSVPNRGDKISGETKHLYLISYFW